MNIITQKDYKYAMFILPNRITFTPTYDADGNQTTVKTKTGIWQVTYNAENRPVKWTCGATNLVMAFDRMGRRVLSEVQVEGTPVKTETYVYDGYTCILRQTTLHTNATPTVVRDTFIWDPTEPVATRPLVWNRIEEKGSSRETHPIDEDKWYTFKTIVKLSPCEYDLDKFYECIKNKIPSEDKKDDWKWRGWHNCGDFILDSIKECKEKSKRM